MQFRSFVRGRVRLRPFMAACVVAGAAAGVLAPPAQAQSRDGWRLLLSWSPEYCQKLTPGRQPECGEEHYFVVHGLVPTAGGVALAAPRDCQAGALPPAEASRWLWVIPNREEILKAWSGLGACSGLPPGDYLAELDRAVRKVAVPERFDKLSRPEKITEAEIKAAFARSNEGMPDQGLTVVCKAKSLLEVQVCLDSDMQYVACAGSAPGGDQCPGEIRIRPIRLDRQDHPPAR